MSSSEHRHADGHDHHQHCACDHDHGHGHSHGHASFSVAQRWLVTLLSVVVLLVVLRGFIIGQMLVRVTSYSANASYSNAVRICNKVIALDPKNRQALTSLGYAYMDLGQTDIAINVFQRVVSLYPDDRGAASFELAQAYFDKGDFINAIRYFERVRAAGPKAAALLEADILKYRHGTFGFRSLNSMQTLLGLLLEAYRHTGDTVNAAHVQQEYDAYKRKHSRVLF